VHDLIIAGGGPVGAALAAALDASGLSVLLLEASRGGSDDRRSLALSYGSRLILERIEGWEGLSRRTPIDSIHVSQRGGFGSAVMTARDAGVPALGYVVAYSALQSALDRRLERSRVQRILGARVTDVDGDVRRAAVSVEHGGTQEQLACSLAVVADGGAVARTASLQETWDYHQSAIVAEVDTDPPNTGRAFERFTADGPIALLPCGRGYALVWTVPPDDADQLCGLSTEPFLARLQAAFGYRAGRFVAATPRAAYPLRLRRARATHMPRVVLVGNAAQTLHPVAGQGLNLGLRDAFELARRVAVPGAVAEADFAERFHRGRGADRRISIFLTDALARGFSSELAWVGWLRGCGLTLLDSAPAAKRGFMARMMFGT
jgi:2-octaprenyl-6-methoxyphenol hydroxylase